MIIEKKAGGASGFHRRGEVVGHGQGHFRFLAGDLHRLDSDGKLVVGGQGENQEQGREGCGTKFFSSPKTPMKWGLRMGDPHILARVGLLSHAGASLPERGLSQTAARVLARALNLPTRANLRHAAS